LMELNTNDVLYLDVKHTIFLLLGNGLVYFLGASIVWF
jgi:hypothetical protein